MTTRTAKPADFSTIRVRFMPSRTAHIVACEIEGRSLTMNAKALCGRSVPPEWFPAIRTGYDCITCCQRHNHAMHVAEVYRLEQRP